MLNLEDLNDDQITLIQIGIDGALKAIVELTQQTIVGVATAEGAKAAAPLTGLVEAINDPTIQEGIRDRSQMLAFAILEETQEEKKGKRR
jgi:uncharacterized protein YjgD (DUF1641 family)